MPNIESRTIQGLGGSVFDRLGDAAPADIQFHEYALNGITGGEGRRIWMDFQTLNLMNALRRAREVEKQVGPQATVIMDRNRQLEELGKALAQCSSLEAKFKSDDGPDKQVDAGSDRTLLDIMNKYFHKNWVNNDNWTMADLKDSSQLLKTKIDALNADAQADMTSLQGLIDKRDQSFTLASDMMSSDSDALSSIIRNIVP